MDLSHNIIETSYQPAFDKITHIIKSITYAKYFVLDKNSFSSPTNSIDLSYYE